MIATKALCVILFRVVRFQQSSSSAPIKDFPTIIVFAKLRMQNLESNSLIAKLRIE